MKTEISAGGVVVKKLQSGIYVLCQKDMSGAWTFPKGLIEKNEKTISAARREIFEETGVTNLVYQKVLGQVEYDFRRHGKIHKIVKYYLFDTNFQGKLTPQKEEGIKAVKWMKFTQALANIGYRETNIPILQKVASYFHI